MMPQEIHRLVYTAGCSGSSNSRAACPTAAARTEHIPVKPSTALFSRRRSKQLWHHVPKHEHVFCGWTVPAHALPAEPREFSDPATQALRSAALGCPGQHPRHQQQQQLRAGPVPCTGHPLGQHPARPAPAAPGLQNSRARGPAPGRHDQQGVPVHARREEPAVQHAADVAPQY